MENKSCSIEERLNYKTVDYFYAYLMIITYVFVTILFAIASLFYIEFHVVLYVLSVLISLSVVNLFSKQIDKSKQKIGGKNYGNMA